MGKFKWDGSPGMRISSFLAINKIAIETFARHAIGRRLEPTWGADIEIGVRFARHQFTQAMAHDNMAKGRLLFDSLQMETDDVYDVTVDSCAQPKGLWHRPNGQSGTVTDGGATLLYLHGGGYTFHGAVSQRYASMLAHHIKLPLFAPDYRLTPEHPHPAQAEDALAAWNYLTVTTPPEKIVVIGDSAGGHMALMLLQTLKAAGRQQPALCVGLCPWTDIGARGNSLHGNDQYDLVQGWMALKFGEWLDPNGHFGRNALSPISHDYSGLAPLYLQAGGREVLKDMIKDFAQVQYNNGAEVMLDVWADMPHDFQAYDSLKTSSTEALKRISLAVHSRIRGEGLAPLDGISAIYCDS